MHCWPLLPTCHVSEVQAASTCAVGVSAQGEE